MVRMPELSHRRRMLVLGAVTSGRWALGTAERTAERLEPAQVREAVRAAERA
jgi:hypothetical protein